MGNVAYRVWSTEKAPVDQVQKAIDEMDGIEVIKGDPQNYPLTYSSHSHLSSFRYYTFEFGVTAEGRLLTNEESRAEGDKGEEAELMVSYIGSFISLGGIPKEFAKRGYTAAIGLDGGFVGIPNLEVLDTIQSIFDPITPGGMWDFVQDEGFVGRDQI